MAQSLTTSISNTLFDTKEIGVDVLRLDLIHPQVSGNKSFKLKYWLEEAAALSKKNIVSFGGAYSNHLIAVAYSCASLGLRSTGFIRGEEPKGQNPSLAEMRKYGMELVFVSRDAYRQKEIWIVEYLRSHPEAFSIPEGGAGILGIKGAKGISSLIRPGYTHIACAVGTGTTFAGLINGADPVQQVMGVYCLKIAGEQNTVTHYVQQYAKREHYTFMKGYDFGGFGKKTEELIHFMNVLYDEEKIPTDFVYTGKLFFALYDLVAKDYFASGSRILVVHSGGLQGNRSLPQGALHFPPPSPV